MTTGELYVGIYPDKSMVSSTDFLDMVVKQCPYTIEKLLTGNGTEYKGRYGEHLFMKLAGEVGITQKFTKVNTLRPTVKRPTGHTHSHGRLAQWAILWTARNGPKH